MGEWGPALPGGACPPLPQGSDPGRRCPCLGLPLALLCACAQLLCLPVVEWGGQWDDARKAKTTWCSWGEHWMLFPAPAGT